MVRETRHLWVGNLPDNIREDRIREHFKRYGRVQSVKLLPRSVKEETGENTTACTVAFMDIKSASKAHTAEHKIDDRTLTTEYYEPAAIPSAASPQNTNSTYSTSPGSTRFANSHGNNARVAEGDYIRRPSYHDSRGRNRDRGYRNGPYNNVIDRHRPLNNSWSYDSSRSYNSETGYGTTTSETNDRRSSDSQGAKKKTKSRSGSRSVSPSGSASSRSPTRSRSQSSSSSSSSTTSQASSSTSSPKSRRVAASANASHQPVVHSDDRRPLAICVRNLPLRSSDTSLKDGLFHEYKKHGKVTWVKIVGQGSERHAIVCFKKPEDVDKALEVSYDKLFFGCKIEVAPYQGYDVDDNELRPYEAEIDEFHPKATRTLFIGNLEKDVTASDLRKHFDQFGEIIEIDIKKQGAVSSYAFCQYSDIISVVKAIRAMDGEHLGNNRIKLGFGKSMPTNCVWVDGVVDSVNEKYLTLQFDSFGPISQVIIDRDKGQALIFYEQVVNAQAAVAKMRGVNMRGRKMQVDFASRECQEAFYEHLEKQGHTAERANFEERRDSTTRTFDSAVTATTRFTRYETPSARPRTASYSGRTGATTGQCNATATVHSPSTPGSVTPRGSGSRSKLARFSEYYDQTSSEYGERRYRSYDEYSQGSGASHEDGYEHEYPYNRESPSHADPSEARAVQHTSDHVTLPFAPPDIRNLQKERYHLLEQLEDYPSSGDELASPKKRIRLDILEGSVTSDVIIEANRDHRKVMEVRRTSEGSLKHHSRRPSVDSKHSVREVGAERGAYMPHAVCKRRKTAGSDSSSRMQHHDLSGSESVGSSRPGTPLCDERPENLPTEPRRIPREREGPLSLPLPRFAAQVMGKGSVSVAGIKGQKDNVLASPPPAATSPRISNPVTPSLAQVPPPASPPPRPPSLSSNSSDSDGTPPSPSLDERIRSLDEKYEKWSGSRAVSAAGSEALAKLDASASERFKFSYKLLDLDLKELQPSDIVKSVLAKPSVFDEDSKRLENAGEKYDSLFSKTSSTTDKTSVPAAPLSAPPVLKITTPTTQLPKTPTMLSPRSAGSNITTAKSLQYPFPSHPPVQLVISASAAPTSTPALQTPPLPSATTRGNHGDNRLKPCANAANSDNRTSCKVGVNRSASSGVVISNLTHVKISDPSNTSKNGVNIPVNSTDAVQSANANPSAVDVNSKQSKSAREGKSADKNSDKVANRRDSTSSGGSPRSEIKNRRNSENSGRSKSDVGDKQNDICDTSASERKLEEKEKNDEWKKEQQRLENERIEKERLEKERLEKERLEKERLEKERMERERLEKERLEKERLERERLEKERLEKERIEREHKREREERERKEREDRERREREEQERERKERREKEEREKREREERERKEKEKEEQDRLERERKREDERKHKDDNHEKRKEEHVRHREIHGEIKHKENAESTRSDKNTKENKIKDNQELFRKDSHESRNSHDNKSSHENRDRHNNEIRKEEKSKHHIDKDVEKRKESSKENRENNVHDKIANVVNEIKENNKPNIESRHFSIDLDKNKLDLSRRKERNNSLPASVGSKRRLSSQESLEVVDEIKKIKLSQDHRKITERRDSKDTRSDEKVKSKHKNNIAKIIEDKMRQEKFNSVKEVTEEKRKDKERDKEDKHKHKKVEKQKSKDKNREKDSPNSTKPPVKELSIDKEFLARLELQSTEDSEKLQRQRKEAKEKRKQDSTDSEDRKIDDPKKNEERKKEKLMSSERKSRDENSSPVKTEDRKLLKKERTRKSTHNSSDAATDSDEPKKQPHSIFDIVDDEPAYISMYDKVKARSCKNMQKQEEEKRQEKLKAKFSQLKQSRAKREEKKRSTSWDEDSDSDHERRERSSKMEGSKSRRGTKMLIMSSDDDEHGGRSKQRKKREIYTDSDSEKHRTKSEHMETSEDEAVRNKSIQRKSSKSRIASDTSDDEFKKVQNKIKSEMFSDNEMDPGFVDLDEKPHKRIKEEESKYIKKEKKNKHQELTAEQINVQIFGESPLPEIKSEDKFDSSRVFGDVSSAEENHDIKKEKSEMRKKHKKKQKRQKHSITSEDDTKLELTVELIKDESIDRMKNSEKKKQHSKKDKKKDKSKDEEKHKDKSKKSKKSKSEFGKGDSKRDGKMENIFGSFSDDSESGQKEQERSNHAQTTFLDRYGDEKLQMYASDSDSISHIEKEIHKSEEKERKEEHKKRKEKKRREKEKRMREEELNENSMDYIDMAKQLEANIKDDSNDMLEATTTSIKSEPDEKSEDVFRFTEGDESQEIKIEQDRKEGKEKKKKRKKSKEEKHKHHHHHHDKNKLKSPEINIENVKNEQEKPNLQSPSLPNILDLPSPPLNKTPSSEYSVSPVSRDLFSSSLPKTPTSSKEKKRDKLIPGFGTEIDEKVHETAVKSICEFETSKSETPAETKEEPIKTEKPETPDDKPRVVISQEETEDAVAALLGESFGGEYSSCYTEEQPSLENPEPEATVPEENVEDLEEMRQAVQSLNSGELEIKPDTPQSEHELQIDTDTDEQEDIGLRYDQSPRTPEMIDLSQPPKTPDIPSYFRSEDQAKTTLVIKANLSSPPSLTPIKPSSLTVDTKRNVEALPTAPKSCPPVLPVEQPRPAVTPTSWPPVETKPVEVPKSESTPIKTESSTPAPPPPPPLTTSPAVSKPTLCVTTSPLTRAYSTPPVIKIAEKPLPVSVKHETLRVPSSEPASIKPHVAVSYMSMHLQKQQTPAASPKVTTPNVPFNRLPITPIMMSKPFQSTTVALPQPKLAQTSQAADTSTPGNPEQQTRVLYQPPFLVNSQPQARLLIRGITTQSQVKHIPPVSYGYPSSAVSSVPKEVSAPEPPRLVPTSFSVAYSLQSQIPQPSQIHPQSVISDSKQADIKPFMPVIQETPKLVSLSSSSVSSPSIIQSTPKPSVIPQTFGTPKPKPVEIKEEKEPTVVVTEKPIEKPKLEEEAVKKEVIPEPLPQLAVAKVTEELHLSLKEEQETPMVEEKVKSEPVEEKAPVSVKPLKMEEKTEQKIVTKIESETPSVIKKTEKLEEDKGDTESIESELVSKDDGLDSKEDSDYWSAKEVNIDSVIKKVDALCSADELSDRSSEIGKDDWYEQEMKTSMDTKPEVVETPQETIDKVDEAVPEITKVETEALEEENEHPDEKEVVTRGGRRGGRARGRKARGVDRGGVQTRRGKVVKEEAPSAVMPPVVAKRGGRGGRPKNERKIPKSESDTADIYEFRDDSDENNVNKDRPRLILTIKSPAAVPNANSANTQTAVVKEVVPVKENVSPKPETKEDFVSPTNTRKSRRLQERDVSRNSVDDTIEDVVRNTAMVTRSSTAAAAQSQIRRSTRQTAIKAVQETPRKSPRGGTKKKDRRASETTDDSSEEKSVKNEPIGKMEPENIMALKEPVKEAAGLPKEKPHEGLKAAVLRRVKGELVHQEPMTLIDPVTGLLTPMREYEEGRYIPVSGAVNHVHAMKLATTMVKPIQTIQAPPLATKPLEPQPQSVIASSPAVIQQHKPQSLKAHVLSSQAARVVVSQQQPQKLVTVAPPVSQPTFVVKSSIPVSQHLNVSVPSPNLPAAHVSPRPTLPPNISKTMHTLPPGIKVAQQPAPPSPNQVITHGNQQPKQQQHMLQTIPKQSQAIPKQSQTIPKQPQTIPKQSQSTVSKAHLTVPVASNAQQVVNTQMAHMKQVVIGKGQVIKPHNLHPQPQILTGAVASPPLKQTHHAGANSGRLVQGSASVPSAGAKSSMEPPKVEVSMGGCVMVPHPTSSPQGQPRHVLQTGLPMPTFEASLGEAMTHFPPGSVKLRPPHHDLLPAHYMHPQHVMYQQYLRQSYHLPRSPLVSTNLEKTGDGQEGEEAPVELRRPGSVGLALTGRSPAVPHSLQSPHDRATDSPQVGQVYSMHNSRMQHYHPSRYYDQAAEPPPAHRPLTSHGSLAALGSDRPLSHIGTLGTPDRPLSSHIPPDRPLSSHLPPDRPLSSHSALAAGHINSLGAPERPLSSHLPDRPLSNHGFPLGTGLGAAGNLMGAVARHVGAEAPASQRGLQAATPPHASQVPPQAESLLMLLKQYPCMWQGLLALKNDQAAVQMYFVSGNDQVAKCSLPKNTDGSTPPLRIFQRMRLEPPQVEGVARKMQMENEHCMLLALPCGHDHMDVLKQSTNLTSGFITYLQQKQAAGIVNVAAPGTTQPPAYVVHIFPSCDFVNENLRRIAPNLLERVSDIAHLLIVITTV